MAKSLEDYTVPELVEHARGLESQVGLLNSLTSNPETRETIQRAIKKINPKLSIPEIDNKDALMAPINELREDNAKLRREIQEKGIRERIERDRATTQSKYKLSDEDMKGVEALMVDAENPIPTYDAAARVFLASRASAVPTPASFQPPTYTMPEKDVWGPGIGNKAALGRVAMDEAYKAWNEIASGKVAGLGGAKLN